MISVITVRALHARLRRLASLLLVASMAVQATQAVAAPSRRQATAQTGKVTETWTYYSNGNFVKDLQVDGRTGMVWAATTGGAVSWDPSTGTSRRYTVQDGLAGNKLTAVAIDPNTGAKWFGTADSGASVLTEDGRWTTYGQAHGLVDDYVHDIAIDAATRDVWFVSSLAGGISRLDAEGRWTTSRSVDELDRGIIRSVAVDQLTGDRWFGSLAGAHRYAADGTWTLLDTAAGLVSNNVGDIAIDPVSGARWFGTSHGASRLSADGEWTSFTQSDGLVAAAVLSIATDPATGDTWFGAPSGASRLAADGRWTTFAPQDGVPDASVQGISGDASTGALWFGTYGGGIARRGTDGHWSTYETVPTVAGTVVQEVAIDPVRGDTWIGSMDGGVSRLTAQGDWTSYTSQDGLAGENVWAIAVDPSTGDTWFGGLDGGASRRTAGGDWATFTSSDGLGNDWVRDIAIDPSSGDTWFGTAGGASRLARDGAWTTLTSADGLANDGIRSIQIDATSGDMWFGTEGGASRLGSDGRWTTLTMANGLVDDDVSQVHLDVATDDVWFGYFMSGRVQLLRPRDRWTTFDLSGFVWPVPSVHGIVRTHEIVSDATSGSTWIAFERGLHRVRPNSRAGVGLTSYTTVNSGMPGNRAMAVSIDPATGDKWIGTDGGVAVLSDRTRAPSACEIAAPLVDGADLVTTLDSPDEADYYRFEVNRPFTNVQLSIPDPDNQFGIQIFRACGDAIGSGSGRHIGSGSGRHIGGVEQAGMNVGLRTGRYYAKVYSRAVATEFPLRYHLQLSFGALDSEDTRTLILTSAERVADLWDLDADSPEFLAWQDDLHALASRPEVGGLLVADVQYDTDPEVEKAYKRWLEDELDPQRANDVARALRAWISHVIKAIPGIKYVVIAGDDRVVPHYRLPIVADAELDDGWLRETAFMASGEVAPTTTVGAALIRDYTLTDDVYATRAPMIWGGGQPLFVPVLAVGRLVERPSDMSAAIQAYVDQDGDLRVRSTLAAGYDFMQDGVEAADEAFAAAGIGTDSRARLMGGALTPSALRQQLWTTRRDLAFLGVHSTHQRFELPGVQFVRSDAIASATADLGGMVAFGLACHAGLNAPGEGHALGLDFAEAFQRRGATWIGSTGWSYGMERFLGYQERLMSDFVWGLAGPRPARLGEALVEAKRAYYLDHEISAMHAKTLAGTVVYGLPMLRVRFEEDAAHGDVRRATLPDAVAAPVRQAPAGIAQVGRSVLVERTQRVFAPDDLMRIVEPDGGGTYYTFSGRRPRAEAGTPVQPRQTHELGPIDRDGIVYEPRGVVLVGGTYRDEADFAPLVEAAGVMSVDPAITAARSQVSRFAVSGWYPRIPVRLQRLSEEQSMPSRALEQITVGQFHASSRRERLLETVILDEYYSIADDDSAPSVTDVVVRSTADETDLELTATDASGIERVVVAYTVGDGRWQSTFPTVTSSNRWTGHWPLSEAYVVQVVDRAGNVTTVDDAGHIRRPCHGPCDASDGRSTSLSTVWLPRAER